jgi:CheY-like chemotaxis protein
MRRILVIDDQPHVRATVIAALKPKGLEVIGASSGADGLELFRQHRFDLAIVDVYMPGVDGIQVIRKLRERDPAFPIIAMSGIELGPSGRTTLDYLPSAGLANVTCLRKPFRAAELISIVTQILSGENVSEPQLAKTN